MLKKKNRLKKTHQRCTNKAISPIKIPDGGPVIAPQIAAVCPDTPLPVVPLRVESNGKLAVLCGIGDDAIISNFKIENVQDQETRELLAKALKIVTATPSQAR